VLLCLGCELFHCSRRKSQARNGVFIFAAWERKGRAEDVGCAPLGEATGVFGRNYCHFGLCEGAKRGQRGDEPPVHQDDGTCLRASFLLAR